MSSSHGPTAGSLFWHPLCSVYFSCASCHLVSHSTIGILSLTSIQDTIVARFLRVLLPSRVVVLQLSDLVLVSHLLQGRGITLYQLQNDPELVDSDPHIFDHILAVETAPIVAGEEFPSVAEILRHQHADDEIAQWRKAVASRGSPDAPRPCLDQFGLQHCSHMFIDNDGVLKYRAHIRQKTFAGPVTPVLYVPPGLYTEFLRLANPAKP